MLTKRERGRDRGRGRERGEVESVRIHVCDWKEEKNLRLLVIFWSVPVHIGTALVTQSTLKVDTTNPVCVSVEETLCLQLANTGPYWGNCSTVM